MEQPLAILADLASAAHSRIQRDFATLDPIVGVSRNMRSSGIPADLMTIDCLQSGKRIILILHDEQPGVLSYQFTLREADSAGAFALMPLAELTAQTLYQWISGYFLTHPDHPNPAAGGWA